MSVPSTERTVTTDPIAVNGPGEILGYRRLPDQNPPNLFFWTWTAAGGMVDTGIDTTQNNYPYPTWLNDRGQISVVLPGPAAGPDWGYLTPSSALKGIR